jgi:hypothetical protein
MLLPKKTSEVSHVFLERKSTVQVVCVSTEVEENAPYLSFAFLRCSNNACISVFLLT